MHLLLIKAQLGMHRVRLRNKLYKVKLGLALKALGMLQKIPETESHLKMQLLLALLRAVKKIKVPQETEKTRAL